MGLSHKQLGEATKAERTWRRLIGAFPGGYYRWRAMEHLGVAEPLALRSADPQQEPPAWRPLNSHHRLVNELWRLSQVQAAWEAWQAQADPAVAPPPEERLAEGRLRLAVGDTWMGLDQLGCSASAGVIRAASNGVFCIAANSLASSKLR